MKVQTRILSAADTAYLLHAKLGPVRAWADFLTDNIRGKQDVHGHTLMPCCQRKDRIWRPCYAFDDVRAFIQDVLAVEPLAGRGSRRATVEIDTTRGWRYNKFDKHGVPAATASRS